jgi:phosphoglycolate phosphatase
MKFKCVIFDLDGTLLNTLDDIGDSVNLALTRMGLPTYPIERYRYFVGDGMEILARRVLPPERVDDATVAACVGHIRDEYGSRWSNKSRPYDGITDMLNGLVARNLLLGVLSNKPHDFTRVVVEKLLPEWKFDPLLGSRPGVPKKPDPAAALEIIDQLRIPAEEILYVGDTAVDMQTAVAAGMFPVGAVWGFRTAEELRDNGARVLIEHPVDLLRLVK